MSATDIDTSSELWRRECEARHMLALPGPERVATLERIAAKRKGDAADVLAADMRALRAGQRLTP